MNRTDARVFLQDSGYNSLMTFVGRDTSDVTTGYKPALDRAFAIYIQANSLDTTVTTTVVPAEDEIGFQSLLQACTYDLIMPYIVISPDLQVDAPQTNVKFSQIYKMVEAERARHWSDASGYGYSDQDFVGGFKLGLDFNEPSNASGLE